MTRFATISYTHTNITSCHMTHLVLNFVFIYFINKVTSWMVPGFEADHLNDTHTTCLTHVTTPS